MLDMLSVIFPKAFCQSSRCVHQIRTGLALTGAQVCLQKFLVLTLCPRSEGR